MDDETTTEETTETTTEATTNEQTADEEQAAAERCPECGADWTAHDHETDECGGCGRRLSQEAAAEPEEERPRRTRQLPCPMSDVEVMEVGDQIDELISEIEDLEAEKKSAASGFKSQIDAATEKLQKLSKLRRRRTVEREVEVEIETDLARAEETVRRLDTGETVSKRTLSSREVEEQRQVKLPLAPAAKGEEGEGDDPWEKLPAELAGLVEAIDQADAHGEPLPETIATDTLRALVTWGKERGIQPTDERMMVVVKEIAARRKEERLARPKRSLPSVTDPELEKVKADLDLPQTIGEMRRAMETLSGRRR